MQMCPSDLQECYVKIHELKLRQKDAHISERVEIEKELDILRAQSDKFVTEYQNRLRSKVISESNVVQQTFQHPDNEEEVGNEQNTMSFSNVHTVLPLSDFFKRPVKITQFNVLNDDSDTFITIFRPWDLWSKITAVRSKLKNYAFFRGNMKIKFLINSNKFQFGTLGVSYQPLFRYNSMFQFYKGTLTGRNDRLVNYLSQSPEFYQMPYGQNYTGEMTLPFISPRNALRMFVGGPTIGADSSFPDFNDMGELCFFNINPLRSFNEDTQSVRVQVYAYFDDVQLGPPTGTNLDINSESFTETDLVNALRNLLKPAADKVGKLAPKVKDEHVEDEYADSGPITKAASAVTKVASTLSTAPIIGPYAKATGMVTSSISKVANLFGFSKPLNIEPTMSYRPIPTEGMALLSGKDTSIKLSCDPKQEISIVPMGGEDKDPMAISFLASRRSLINSFEWSSSDEEDTVLQTFFVTPQHVTSAAGNNQMSALAFAVSNFNYWRGTISYHIRVAGSQFHRGKLMVVYEPNTLGASAINNSSFKANEHYFTIIDLAVESEIIVDVGYVNTKNFSKITSDQAFSEYFRPTSVLVPGERAENGTITIRVFNELQGGSSAQSETVEVNVSVFSDDIEVAVPRDIGSHLRYEAFDSSPPDLIASEAGAEFVSTYDAHGNMKAKRVLLNQAKHDSKDNAYLYNFGEKVVSYRSLFKRYFTAYDIRFNNAIRGCGMELPLYPPCSRELRPRDSTGFDFTESVANPDSRFQCNLFNFMRFGYLGMKGGMRFRVQARGDGLKQSQVTLDLQPNRSSPPFDVSLGEFVTPSFANNLSFKFGPSTFGGMIYTDDVNSVYEFELPFYSSDLFIPALGLKANNDEFFDLDIPAVILSTVTEFNKSQQFYISQAASEDFTFFRFQGAPSYRNRTDAPLDVSTFSIG